MSGEPNDRSNRINNMLGSQDPVNDTEERPVPPQRRIPPPRTGIREENPIPLGLIRRLENRDEQNRRHHELMHAALRNPRRRRRPLQVAQNLFQEDNPSNRNLEESSSEEEVLEHETEEPNTDDEDEPSLRPPPPPSRRMLEMQRRFEIQQQEIQEGRNRLLELDEELRRVVLEQSRRSSTGSERSR
jgi:hypothetical protein